MATLASCSTSQHHATQGDAHIFASDGFRKAVLEIVIPLLQGCGISKPKILLDLDAEDHLLPGVGSDQVMEEFRQQLHLLAEKQTSIEVKLQDLISQCQQVKATTATKAVTTSTSKVQFTPPPRKAELKVDEDIPASPSAACSPPAARATPSNHSKAPQRDAPSTDANAQMREKLADRRAKLESGKATVVPTVSLQSSEPKTSEATIVPTVSLQSSEPTTSKATIVPTVSLQSSEPKTSKATGVYIIRADAVPVNELPSCSSPEVARLHKTTRVEVLGYATEPVDGRIRAKIASPAGWISIRMADGTYEFAVKADHGKRRKTLLRHPNLHTPGGPLIESGVKVGSHVIAKLKNSWIGSPYVYADVSALQPLQLSHGRGHGYDEKELKWVMLATDDGWLSPFDLDWQRPGCYVLIQLLNSEWLSARVASNHKMQQIKKGLLHLEIEGIDDMPSVCIQTDVAFLFTPHTDCADEFGHALPSRGGHLADHLADAFEPEQPLEGEDLHEALRRQRGRWVEASRTDGQYPIRSVWVHPRIKEGALNKFAHRASQKRQESPTYINPEIVMLVGPPAAGKSSISRLKPEQLQGSLKRVRKTADSLKYREEVNNDNLTDCMPGFPMEYKYALSVDKSDCSIGKKLWKRARSLLKSKRTQNKILRVASKLDWITEVRQAELTTESWALQWLTYLVYHHGPVRDSLALDVIKVTVVDAEELPVYYSSCMAGKAVGRAMMILELSQSTTKPVLHKTLPFRGFWPYTSQEARFDRQAGRADEEKKERKLKGGNLTSNLVDIHYHAQQAETNITKMLGSLEKGLKPTDESDDDEEETNVAVDHFLVIDNEGKQPQVLLDFAHCESTVDFQIRSHLLSAVSLVISQRSLFEKEWDAFDPFLFKCCYYFLKVCTPEGHPLRARAIAIRKGLQLDHMPKHPDEVLPLVVELDEEVYQRKYGKSSTATDTDQYRKGEHIGDAARECLATLSEESVENLKQSISVMRKYTCLAIMQNIKSEGNWVDELIRSEQEL